jgi:hypothetical protein
MQEILRTQMLRVTTEFHCLDFSRLVMMSGAHHSQCEHHAKEALHQQSNLIPYLPRLA